MTDVSAFLRQILGYCVECTLFHHLFAVTLVAGGFALARKLTRRPRSGGGAAT